ncbi:MAG TPA: methylmalonyl-CoA mutase family protein, partial [Bacteroidales bacterium]|nr:methylmalonyl-CoA mutase family protein [Bacteroidales bacterium]
MPEREKLFEQFPPVSSAEWMDRIKADLKGADFNSAMVWKTSMGFDVLPFYRQEDIKELRYIKSPPGESPFIRGKKISGKWRIRQDIVVSDYAEANRKAVRLTENG